jgi:cytoskeleton protein RodZ
MDAVYSWLWLTGQHTGGIVHMGELGDLLRKAREDRGLSLAQVEAATRIRSDYLQALEREDYDRLPAPVYVKGFLRNYALHLDLDAKQVLSLYEQPEAPAETTPVPMMLDEPLEPLSLRRFRPVGLAALLIAVVAISWWGYQRYPGKIPFVRATATPTAAFTATAAPPTPTVLPPTATPSPARTASPTLTPTVVGLQLSIEVVGERSWLLVQADGERVFAGILEPGAKDTWTARDRIVLRSGNAGAVRVTLNGQALGLFGEIGQVVETEWTMPGVPTRTPVPTTAP